MKHYTVVGNWKMHLGPKEAAAYVKKLKTKIIDHPAVTVVLAPPFVDLATVGKTGHLKLGAQNLCATDEGAYTGEVSGPMLKEIVDYVIVGHSERRKHFHETDKVVGLKLAAAVRNGLIPILCVGENLHQREAGHSVRVVVDQLIAALANLTATDLKHLHVAYEPVWAIGTGRFAKPDEVTPVVSAIHHTIKELYNAKAADGVKILYGGSVDADDASAYLKVRYVNGVLVGGASLNAESFGGIVRAAQDRAIS